MNPILKIENGFGRTIIKKPNTIYSQLFEQECIYYSHGPIINIGLKVNNNHDIITYTNPEVNRVKTNFKFNIFDSDKTFVILI